VIAYLAKLDAKQLRTSSIKQKLSALRQFFKFPCQEKLINADPTVFRRQPKPRRPIPRIIDQETAMKLRDAIPQLNSRMNQLRTQLKIVFISRNVSMHM
jgi:site-specific recombinase XerD